MPTKKIQPRNNKSDISLLNAQQQKFVAYLLADDAFSPTNAARQAGYKNHASSAYQLMRDKRITDAIGNAVRLRLKRIQLTQEDVIEHLRVALFLNPLEIFEVGHSGSWLVKDLSKIPEAIARCITKIKAKETTDQEGITTKTFEIELMDKNNLLVLAMKHLGIAGETKVNIGGQSGATEDFLLNLLQQVKEMDNVVDADVIDAEIIDQPKLEGHSNGKA